jgi:hypothetical protein
MATTTKRFPIYAYSAPLRGARANALAAKGYDVTVVVERTDGRAMTERELHALEAAFPAETAPARKATTKRAAAKTARR